MKWYVVKNDQYGSGDGMLSVVKRGWGNGYVTIPPTHPLWKIDYDNVESIDVHGGLTFSKLNPQDNYWVFGFDTCHYGDTLDKWSKEVVEAETKRLFCQLLDIELGGL